MSKADIGRPEVDPSDSHERHAPCRRASSPEHRGMISDAMIGYRTRS